MQFTGVVRRFDDLGRIVVPKHIRKMVGIEERDAFEIYVNSDNSLTLRKYEPNEIIENDL